MSTRYSSSSTTIPDIIYLISSSSTMVSVIKPHFAHSLYDPRASVYFPSWEKPHLHHSPTNSSDDTDESQDNCRSLPEYLFPCKERIACGIDSINNAMKKPISSSSSNDTSSSYFLKNQQAPAFYHSNRPPPRPQQSYRQYVMMNTNDYPDFYHNDPPPPPPPPLAAYGRQRRLTPPHRFNAANYSTNTNNSALMTTGNGGGANTRTTSSQEPTKTLFVGNLPIDITEDYLNELFSRYGVVTECCKRWFHYAFVRFSTEAEAESALRALSSQRLKGRLMRIEFQRKKPYRYQQVADENVMMASTSRLPATALANHQRRHATTTGSGNGTHECQLFHFGSFNGPKSIFTRPGEPITKRRDFEQYELFPANKPHPIDHLLCTSAATTPPFCQQAIYDSNNDDDDDDDDGDDGSHDDRALLLKREFGLSNGVVQDRPFLSQSNDWLKKHIEFSDEEDYHAENGPDFSFMTMARMMMMMSTMNNSFIN